ncbi:MAG: MFS transporter [Candidatus Acidiferrales bacterium]
MRTQDHQIPGKRWLRIIPVALLMYTIAFINRTNISLALPDISRNLQMNPNQAGEVAGIFFWGYLLLQIPGGYLAEHWSAKRFVAILLAAWGLCAAGCGLVSDWHELWIMRLFLGVAEGGVYPATLVLLSHWFPRRERARANAFWNLCLPLAVVVSSPLSGWILDRWNWRVMLISSGVLPFVWLPLWAIFIDDRPKQARWLSERERKYLEDSQQREAAQVEPRGARSYLRALLCPQVLVLMGTYFLLITGQLGVLFWLPSALEKSAGGSNFFVAILFTVPYIIGAASMVLNSLHSDRTRERRAHVGITLGVGGVLLLAAVELSGVSPLLAYILVCLAAAGSYAPLGPFWTIPSEMLPKKIAGSAMGLINAVGNLGGYFGPLVVGYLDKTTGGFRAGFGVLAAGMMAGGLLAFFIASPNARPATN